MKKNLHVLALLILILPISYVLLWTTAYQEMDIDMDDQEISIEGFMGETIPIANIDTIIAEYELPKIYSSAGISLKGYEKGFFTRFSDQKQVKIIAHHKKMYIKIVQKNGEIVYYNTDSMAHTKALYNTLEQTIFKK